jgi:hypothetical protein
MEKISSLFFELFNYLFCFKNNVFYCLLGIDRKIAYANRKYHSGWICTGVTSGLAGVKLSGSPSI